MRLERLSILLNKFNKRKKGFTLLELIISIALVAVFIIPIGNIVLGTVKINRAGENKQQAGIKLQEAMENIKSMDLPLKTGEENAVTLGDNIYIAKVDDKNYKVYAGSDYEENHISIEGTIKLKESEDEGLSIGDSPVSGILYYNRKDNTLGIGESGSNNTLEKAITKVDSIVSGKTSGSEADINIDASGKIQIHKVGTELTYSISSNDGIVIFLGQTGEEKKLKINIQNLSEIKVPIYIYNCDGVSSRNDIEIGNYKGEVNIVSGFSSKSIFKEKNFQVDLKARKDGNVVETSSFVVNK